MQDLNRDGQIRAIGVANFYPDRLIDLIDHNEITPAVNQIETHPFLQHTAEQGFMRERGVQIESWGPFAEGKNNLHFQLTDDQQARIADLDTGKTLFFDHHDPEWVTRLGNRRVD